ncbi:UbiD-like decarboxylase [Actinocatenispora thailandica]|uniref:Pyrrole-2-carboxylic acid decarboxylase n=1 Tax=Actinocatenispora thailandica TaxID=227318 RepID=A0A7R7HZ37_9ACTN|nr:UbiD family decarboxylase [Actinocatenispora thailandica]BCJ36934.1 UbiD-like decarboxylase [Actinocatenispora thailandica]
MTHLRSLRDFIDELAAIGEIQQIDAEVDWNLEIGAIIRRSYDLRAPAPLCTNITGYQDSGFRVLGAPGGLSNPEHPLARIALALGLPADAAGRDIMEAIVAARRRPGVPPVPVAAETAPCKQNVLRGDDIDLLRFPTPLIHGNDGGRYIQTYGMNIVATPDGSWTNWSINRMMIAGRDTLACLIPPPQHLGIIRAKWAKLGKPMPIVLALGVEPALPYAGAMPLPEDADESHFVGALFGEGVEVVPAETVDLPVPATAEIVIEGHIALDDEAMEGPMNEYPGYNAHDASPKPLFTVTAITHRDGAILPVVAAGPPVEEDHTGTGTMHAAEILHQLRLAGLPVASTWFSYESALHWLIVSVRPEWHEETGLSSEQLAQRIGEVVFAGKAGFGVPKVLLVEDDIDITKVDEVVWAFATRTHPEHGEIHFPHRPTAALSVYLDESERHTYNAGKVIYNCLLADRFEKEERPVKGSFEHGWPAEIQQRVLDNWRRYGYR